MNEWEQHEDLISVIIPVFQVEPYLRKCLDSVINQTYSNLEIILVDDGSYDNGGLICDEYALHDNRVVVIHKENGGLSSARNAGLEVVSGEYVAFVDSDDWLEPDMYETMITQAKRYDADVTVVGFYRLRATHMWAFFNDAVSVMTSYDALAALVDNGKMKNYSTNKLYKRDLFHGVTYPLGQVFEDIPVTYQLFEKANKVLVLNTTKYYYMQRNQSITSDPSVSKYIDFCLGHQERFEQMKDKYPEFRQQLIDSYIRQALLPLSRAVSAGKYQQSDIALMNKLNTVKKFAADHFSELQNSALIGRVGKYRLQLFSRGDVTKLVTFDRRFIPLYNKVIKLKLRMGAHR